MRIALTVFGRREILAADEKYGDFFSEFYRLN